MSRAARNFHLFNPFSLSLLRTSLGAAALMASCTAFGAGPATPGLYYYGHEVESFQPCRSKQAFWVTGSESILQPLREHAEKLRESRGKPYQPIYVEFVGRIGPRDAGGGFAASYDGVYQLERVQRVSNVVPKSCSP